MEKLYGAAFFVCHVFLIDGLRKMWIKIVFWQQRLTVNNELGETGANKSWDLCFKLASFYLLFSYLFSKLDINMDKESLTS